jgi:16S rRNA (guanine966-N2)-methyltransferase
VVRIIAGRLGGRKLKTLEGEGYRPAMGRTRESLFSMLEARGLQWHRTRVLDLFAGSGSLAIEALSRGATHALLVELSQKAARCLGENIASLGLEKETQLINADVLRILRHAPKQPYELIFLDPPYRKNLAGAALQLLLQKNWLAPGAFVTAELEKELQVPVPATFDLEAERLLGQTRICIWTHNITKNRDAAQGIMDA